MDEPLRNAALEYHRLPTPGKISVTPTKGLTNPRDLALACSPGVAVACEAIVADPGEARSLTARGNPQCMHSQISRRPSHPMWWHGPMASNR
jgi:malate dehydrogenase (oxaloacetate-decarboxylating)(NADP+)